MDPAPSRSIQRPGFFRALEEKLREKAARSVGLCYAACQTEADAIWLQGREKHTGEQVKALYFGSGRSFAHLVDKLYSNHTIERRIDNLRIWSASRYFREAQGSVDICFADLPWPYSQLYGRGESLHIPGWIIQKIMIPDTWDAVVKQFRKNTRSTDLRKVRKYKLEYKISRDKAEIDHFYDTMYEPYAKQRFGDLSVIDDREEIAASGAYRQGGLLQVVHEGRVVAGVVLYQWRRIMHFLWFGVAADLESGLADAALSGIYLFSIQHAYNQGCTEMNLSFTIPLLNDGVFRYKRKWGAGVHNAWKLGEIVARPFTFGPAIRSFFGNQPMIVREGDRLIGKVLVPEAAATPENIAKLIDGYASAGLHALQFFSTQPLTIPGAPTDEDPHIPTTFVDLSASSNPALDFCKY